MENETQQNKIIKFKSIIENKICEIKCNNLMTIKDYIKDLIKEFEYDEKDELKFNQGSIKLSHDTLINQILTTIPVSIYRIKYVKKEVENLTHEQKYTIDEIHSVLPFFLIYFKHKDFDIINLLLQQNDNLFVDKLLKKKYLELVKIIMKQSSKINESLKTYDNKTPVDCSIQLPDSESLEILASRPDITYEIRNTTDTKYIASTNGYILTDTDIVKISLLQSKGYDYNTAKFLYLLFPKGTDINTIISSVQKNSSENIEK